MIGNIGTPSSDFDEKGGIIRENNIYFTFDLPREYDTRGNTIQKDDLTLTMGLTD